MRRYFPKQQKYSAQKVTVDGITFDSKREAARYCELKLLERAGKITNLRLQQPFELVPVQREEDIVLKSGKIKPGKIIERAVTYVADFVYVENGNLVVEDTKGMRTKEYIIKRKLMLYRLGIRIREV